MASPERIEQRIYILRGQRVMIDRDLAPIFGVSTRRLNDQVTRNRRRFPADFAFRLSKEEMGNWISQCATPNFAAKMGLRKPPYAFTEHGAVAAAFVLNSPVAVSASIRIVRAFNRLRQMALGHKELALALADLARRVSGHDEQFRAVFDAIRKLTEPLPELPVEPRKQIGFQPPKRP